MFRSRSLGIPTLIFIVLAALLATLAYQWWRETRFLWNGPVLNDIRDTGTLRVLTRNTSTTYYIEHDEPAGPEYDLAKAFADSLGVKLQIIVKDSIGDLLSGLATGEGHLIAAGITRTDTREDTFRFGPDYQSIQQQVVCRRDAPLPTGPEQLAGRSLAIISDSAYEQTLKDWQAAYPGIVWQMSSEHSTEQIMESAARGVVDCVLADSNIVAVNLRYLPELSIAFAAGEPQSLAWVLPSDGGHLEARLHNWLDDEAGAIRLPAILYRYYGHIGIYEPQDLAVYERRIASRLPALRPLFEDHARRHGFAWTLIAAQAYQESHWDSKAVSPTGVRGVMMLTRNTAKAMKVKDRRDPAQSIAGGTRYLARLYARLPADIRPKDRIWFALAAYTLGLGHIQDARALAISLGRDANSWHGMSEILPLLSQKHHYRDLRHGFARGNDAIRYVTRVRNYHDVLLRNLP